MTTSFSETMGMMRSNEFNMNSHSSHRRCGNGHERRLFLEKVSDKLVCGVCKDVARYIVNGGDCGHAFCHCCLLSLKETADKTNKRAVTCPVDKRIINMEKYRYNASDDGDIMALRVRCVNADAGCKESFPLANMEYHVNNECAFRRVKCEVCDQIVGSMDDHLGSMEAVQAHIQSLAITNTKLKQEMATVLADVSTAQREHSVASTKLHELRQVLEEVKGHQSARLDVIEEYLRHKAGQELFPSSSILNAEQQEALHEIHPDNDCGWALLYKASLSGLKPEIFHNLVDGHRNTMVIFQSGGNDIFGAFASQSWDNQLPGDEPQWKPDDRAYVFSIGDEDPVEVTLEHENDDKPIAICCHSLLGPTWGDGEQIFMGGRFGTSEFTVAADGAITFSTPGPMSDDQIKELEVYVQIDLAQ